MMDVLSNPGFVETFGGIAVLMASWILVGSVGHGFSSTVKRLALWLYDWAVSTEERHARAAAELNAAWVRRLGRTPVLMEREDA